MSNILPMRTETAQVHLGAIALDKAYRKGQHRVPVLRGVDVSIGRGEFLSIVGQSGSGKSTLLHLLGLLDTPDMGEVRLEGQRIDDLPQATRDELRNRIFGFVFQFYHLLPELTLLENVITPLLIRCSPLEYWRKRKTFRNEALEVLEKIGLSHRIHHRPSELSGGEMRGRHRPGPYRQAGSAPRRRADRQPRCPHRTGDHRPAQRVERAGKADYHHGDT